MSTIDSLDKIKQIGNEHYTNKNYEQAMVYYNAVLHHTGLLPNHHSGAFKITQRNIEKVNNLRISALKNMSLIHFKQNHYNKCMDKCTMILHLLPNGDQKTYYRYGMVLKKMGQPRHAPYFLNKALEMTTNIKQAKAIQNEIRTCKNNTEQKMDIENVLLQQQTNYNKVVLKQQQKLSIQSSKLFNFVSIPFKGYGLIASKKIKKNAIIFSEKALFSLNIKTSDDPIDKWFDAYNKSSPKTKELIQLLYSKNESWIKYCSELICLFDSVRPKFKGFYSIHDRIITNVYRKMAPNGKMYDVIFNTISRINHSCEANVKLKLRDVNGCDVVAVRDIQKGEEITSSYLCEEELKMDVIQRRMKLLEEYVFYCECNRCCSEDIQ
eukprot:71904_1